MRRSHAFPLLVLVAFFVIGGPAWAGGPSGSTQTGNEVDCNESSSTDVGGVFNLYAGANGVEGCADGSSSLPIDGSAYVDAEDGYVAIDGDNSNAEPANGYARVDSGGVHCGDDTNQDASSADQSQNTVEDCG